MKKPTIIRVVLSIFIAAILVGEIFPEILTPTKYESWILDTVGHSGFILYKRLILGVLLIVCCVLLFGRKGPNRKVDEYVRKNSGNIDGFPYHDK